MNPLRTFRNSLHPPGCLEALRWLSLGEKDTAVSHTMGLLRTSGVAQKSQTRSIKETHENFSTQKFLISKLIQPGGDKIKYS
jgi:hypothetical protein